MPISLVHMNVYKFSIHNYHIPALHYSHRLVYDGLLT